MLTTPLRLPEGLCWQGTIQEKVLSPWLLGAYLLCSAAIPCWLLVVFHVVVFFFFL